MNQVSYSGLGTLKLKLTCYVYVCVCARVYVGHFKVLHTVCFLSKNGFILQNKFTGLQCNLHCALSQRSNVWARLVFLSGRLRC
jgi:hypothetical protein